MLRALEDHGAGAIVLPSIFEEEILAERREIELRTEELSASGFAEAQTYFPTEDGPRCRPGALSRARAPREGSRRDSGNRQSELHDARRVGWIALKFSSGGLETAPLCCHDPKFVIVLGNSRYLRRRFIL